MTLGAEYSPLLSLPAPAIRESTASYPDDKYKVANLLDENPRTEFAANEQDARVFVEFDFRSPVSLAAFRHVDRNDPARVAESELIFLDGHGTEINRLPVRHVNQPAGETFFVFPSLITAQRVRWEVLKIANPGFKAVGGEDITFFTKGKAEPAPAHDQIRARVLPLLNANGADGVQSVEVSVRHYYPEAMAATLRVGNALPVQATIKPGDNSLRLELPANKFATTENLTLEIGGGIVAHTKFVRPAVRPLTIYVLPHSHTDIGYTEIQTAVQARQVNNLLEGVAAAKRTANYPPGARFVWNVEAAWAADLYLQRMPEAQRQEFFAAVRKGWVGLNGMYLNELTGLCRPEELIRLFHFGANLGIQCGVPVDAAMISDVPGCTWGTVDAMAQAGIKYLSAAPNYFDRIGDILVQNENKPFYWVSASGQEKVLIWIPLKGYALAHTIGNLSDEFVLNYEKDLEQAKYPYEISYLRWAGHGDNATPDPEICEFIKNWNAKHIWPRFVIATTHDAFSAFEQRYGKQLPRLRGDLTPYWEDGAASSARETSINRDNADRLTQAEALWAMLRPASYPARDFNEAWRNVLLYSEHTWGADTSVSAPESRKTIEQWEIKRAYAVDADKESRELIDGALGHAPVPGKESAFAVYNTTSWPRSDFVTLSREQSAAGDRVTDSAGHSVPSQRLASGELCFNVTRIAPFSSQVFKIDRGGAFTKKERVVATPAGLENGRLHIEVDKKTGGIVKLVARGIDENLVDTSSGEQLNEYLFLQGNDLAKLQHNGPVKISIKESGPLVASLVIESEAPGCNSLARELRLAADADYVEIIDTVDKKPAEIPTTKTPDGNFAQHLGKESVNFAFPFHIPDGALRMDVSFGVMQPEIDQLPGACKNWFPVNRWVDVANRDYGVSVITQDAPLIEVGEISARLLGSQTNPDVWRKHVGRTQKFYSWVMNNHWGTNYRGYQDGKIRFRYFLRPHKKLDLAGISRFAIGVSQPLVASQATTESSGDSLLELSSPDVLVTSLKPGDDGRALIVRLFEASGTHESVRLQWNGRQPKNVFVSDTAEQALEKAAAGISLAGFELKTLRLEF